jgi:hypothetical protein
MSFRRTINIVNIKSTTPSLLGRDTPHSKGGESFDWYVFYPLRVKSNQPPRRSWVATPLLQK